MLTLVLDPSPREAEPFTRITRRCRAVRSLPLAPSSAPLIASLQCAAFIEKSELTTGGSLPLCPVPRILITFSTRRSLLLAPCSALYPPIMFSTGQVLASVVPWTSMNHLFLSDIAPETDEKMFAIKYEFSYISR
jgi:hypothetical protein